MLSSYKQATPLLVEDLAEAFKEILVPGQCFRQRPSSSETHRGSPVVSGRVIARLVYLTLHSQLAMLGRRILELEK